MTKEEKQHIKECRIMIVGTDEFISCMKEELCKLGFEQISAIHESYSVHNDSQTDILIEYTGVGTSQPGNDSCIPVIYPFDFIEGAGAIVLFPGDDRKWLENPNIRLWAVQYMSGYCAFWNVEGCDWLHNVLPAVKERKTSDTAQRTAAYMCARIAASIAVGREVKRYPRFYLVFSSTLSTFITTCC